MNHCVPRLHQYHVTDVRTHLVHGAEYVSVILLEAPHTRETGQGSWQLVPVKNSKVGHAERQLSPGARPVIKHQTGGQKKKKEIFLKNNYYLGIMVLIWS